MDLLDSYVFPDGAAEALKKQGFHARPIDNMGNLQFVGNDKGIPYRFFILQEHNEFQSKKLKYPKVIEKECIQWFKDKFQKPVAEVKHLPFELLEFDEDTGECVGGLYKEAYDRYKKGLTTPGLSLSKWGELTDNEAATLAMMGIFSVESLASLPLHKLKVLPPVFQEKFEKAVQYLNGSDTRKLVNDQSETILALQKEKEFVDKRLAEMEEQMKALLAMQTKPKKMGRPKKQLEEIQTP